MSGYSNDPIDLLAKLVSIPSPSGQEARAVTYLAGWLNACGLAATVDEAGNAVGVKGTGPREILLLGHIDTFPGDLPVYRQGDRLYGRGTVDAKGPLCAFAAAAARVEAPPGWRVTVVGAVEEESATSKGARYIANQRISESANTLTATGQRGSNLQPPTSNLQPPTSNFQPPTSNLHPPTFCLIGEPSAWDRITLGYKGRLLLDVMLRAPFSHSAGESRLPAEQGVDFWRQVEELCAALNNERGATTPFARLEPSLRAITSHDEGAFGRVELNLGFRLPLDLAPAELEARLSSLAGHLPPGSTADLRFSGAEAAYKGDKTNPLVRAFLAAIRAAGGQPRFVVKTGTADMNVVGPAWPVTPIVAYGPGDSSLDHTPEEAVDLAEYSRAIDILQAVLTTLMSSPPPG